MNAPLQRDSVQTQDARRTDAGPSNASAHATSDRRGRGADRARPTSTHQRVASASASVDASAQRQAQADASDVVAAQREQSDSARNRTGMPDAVKTQMESAFGADFSDVRVHASSSQATDLNARAYARGNQIHFAPGEYAPSTTEGQAVLGHELAHVVQQREGRVRPTTQVNGVPVNDDPALEREADAQGRRAATSGGAGFP